MDLMQNLSDNETALVGCLGALVASFGLVCGSFHLGRALRSRRGPSETVAGPRAESTGHRATERRAA